VMRVTRKWMFRKDSFYVCAPLIKALLFLPFADRIFISRNILRRIQAGQIHAITPFRHEIAHALRDRDWIASDVVAMAIEILTIAEEMLLDPVSGFRPSWYFIVALVMRTTYPSNAGARNILEGVAAMRYALVHPESPDRFENLMAADQHRP